MLLNPLQSRTVFRVALEHRFALLAVNADSPASLTDVLEAARECSAPVMIETSLWQLHGRSFGAGDPALGLARYLVQLALLAASERYREIPVLLHTDHIKGPGTLALLKSALGGLPTGLGDIQVSPSTISIDSSQMTEEENIGAILELCRESAAVARPVTLEMEAGVDDGVTPIRVAERLLGSVEAVAPGFVHLWAPGVGTRHGLGEQGGFSSHAVSDHREAASRVLGRPVGIALHGSSGMGDSDLRAAVAAGVVKVNWSSESLLVRSRAAAEYFRSRAGQLEPGNPLWKATAMDDGLQSYIAERYQPVVARRIQLLGGAGMASVCRAALDRQRS